MIAGPAASLLLLVVVSALAAAPGEGLLPSGASPAGESLPKDHGAEEDSSLDLPLASPASDVRPAPPGGVDPAGHGSWTGQQNPEPAPSTHQGRSSLQEEDGLSDGAENVQLKDSDGGGGWRQGDGAAYRQKRSYDSNGRRRLAGTKRYDDSYLLSLGYDPTMAWAGKRFDDSYLQSIGYDPTMAWGRKRYDDAFLQSIGYDPTMAWGKKRSDDSFLPSVAYDQALAWRMKHKTNDEFNPAYFYDNYMDKNIMNEKVPKENEEEEDGGNEIPDSYFLPSDINVAPILTKRSLRPRMFIGVDDYKRSPSEMGPRGFHEGIFNDHFGYFSPVKRSKRNAPAETSLTSESELSEQLQDDEPKSLPIKRKFGMGARGFHSDTFSGGFGDFGTMKKRYHGMTSSGFHGDTFSSGFGDFGTMKKRYNDMTSSGFYGDTFSNGFGDFGTMKKRYYGMTSSGFHGDTFSNGFGDFGTMKKRYHGMTSSGFHGDTFSGGFGDFGTMKKRISSATPADYREAEMNRRLAVLLNDPDTLQENVALPSTNSGRNSPASKMLSSQMNGPAASSDGDGESR